MEMMVRVNLTDENLTDFPYLAVVNKLPENFRKIRALLKQHEGFSSKLYTDTVGKPTIGYGRNMVDNGLSPSECLLLLDDDISFHYGKLNNFIKDFSELNEARQMALISMSYNLGFAGFQSFTEMIKAINIKDFETAAKEILDSDMAKKKQFGKRAQVLARIISSGELDTEV